MSNSTANIEISDGATSKIVFGQKISAGSTVDVYNVTPFDLIIYLRAGDLLQGSTSNTSSHCIGSVRQIADNNGTLQQPVGFTPS